MPYRERSIERAYWTIGLIAEELGVATSALRFWESKCPGLSAGRDKKGHRYYNKKERANFKRFHDIISTGDYTVKGAVKKYNEKYKPMIIRLERVDKTIEMPKYHSKGAACFDLAAATDAVIEPGDTVIVSTGLKMEIPNGWEVAIRPRSGMSFKTDLRISNSPGTIDSDYTGVVGILIENRGDKTAHILKGERIAQGKFQKAEQANFTFVENIIDTERGDKGFGSTGK